MAVPLPAVLLVDLLKKKNTYGFDLIKENSLLSVGPVSFGFGSLVSGWLGSCIHPAPVHSLVYKQSGILQEDRVSDIMVTTFFS